MQGFCVDLWACHPQGCWVRGGYPQEHASASGYPQGFCRRLIGRERGGIVGA